MCRRLLLGLIPAFFFLTACGGGGGEGGDSAARNPSVVVSDDADGIWSGTTSDGRSIYGLYVDNQLFYFVYSTATNADAITGFLQGTAPWTDGSFSSTIGTDFNFGARTVTPLSFSGTFTPRRLLTGTLSSTTFASTSFTANFDTTYDRTPSIITTAGTFSGDAASVAGGVLPASVTLQASGSFTFSSGGCTATGTLSARPRKNVLNMSITFGSASACIFPSTTVSGHAYYDPDTRQLFAAATNTGRTDVVFFLGSKP